MSLIELLIVFGIIGVLVNIAVPAYSHAQRNARAAAIVADFRTVQAAATEYYLRSSRWPEESGPGEEPPELADFLAGRIDWSEPVEYDWEHLADDDGLPTHPESGIRVGFGVRTDDELLLDIIRRSETGLLASTWGSGLTFIIEPVGPDEATAVPEPAPPEDPAPPPADPPEADDGDSEDGPPERGGRGRGRGDAPGQNR